MNSLRVFIIDNEVARQRNLRSILSSLGYKSGEVESSDDPIMGIAQLKKKHFNALFVYQVMPKMSGIDVVKEIRSNPRLKSLPVIIYHSEVSKDHVMEAVQAGANGYLGYPFSVSDVESALRHAVKAVGNAR